ncbi:MAG: antitoxin [Desulfurococcales archaeon ex4484_58]|nr:MAG: antitoxin [Desulfurococcales archaeon ex4484_58]
MGEVVEAIYENGVLKPLKKLSLKDGQRVKIMIEERLVDVISRFREKYGTKIPSKDLDDFLKKRR